MASTTQGTRTVRLSPESEAMGRPASAPQCELSEDRMPPWPMVRPVVLAVDDDPGLLRMLALVFAEEVPDVELRTAGTAREAERAALAWAPALILCDIRLPDEDGRHLLARLRLRPGLTSVPSVLMTGLDSAIGSLREEATALHASLLRKPFALTELIQVVGRALARQAAI